MQVVRYSINVTLDGCYDHTVGVVSRDMHEHAAQSVAGAGTILFGKVVLGLMEGWRPWAETGNKPDWAADWMESFATAIHRVKKVVVSDSLGTSDWHNTEVIRRDQLEHKVRQLKAEPGPGILVGGVVQAQRLIELGLIDEFEFVVHPRVVGHGPTLFAGLSQPLDLELTGRLEFSSGAVAMQYKLKR